MSDHARRLCDFAQDVLDRCVPTVPASPLVRLTDHAAALLAPDRDDDDPDGDPIPDAVLDLADQALALSWHFYPPEAFGSSAAIGPSIEELEALREALDIALDAIEQEAAMTIPVRHPCWHRPGDASPRYPGWACSYRMRITDPGCTDCRFRHHDEQDAEPAA